MNDCRLRYTRRSKSDTVDYIIATIAIVSVMFIAAGLLMVVVMIFLGV